MCLRNQFIPRQQKFNFPKFTFQFTFYTLSFKSPARYVGGGGGGGGDASLGPASGESSGSQSNNLDDANASSTWLVEGSRLLETSESGGNFSPGESVGK